MNPTQRPLELLDVLFSEKKLPLLNRLKEETGVSEFDLIAKVNRISKKRREEATNWIRSFDVRAPDAKTYKQIRERIVGVRFATQKHVVVFDKEIPPLKTDYHGTHTSLNTPPKITFNTWGITQNISLLKCALINELIAGNKNSIRFNKNITALNIKVDQINQSIDELNSFIPFKCNNIDVLIDRGKTIMEKFYVLVRDADLHIPGGYPSEFCRQFCESNDNILLELEIERNRDLRLKYARPIAHYLFIDLRNNNKLNFLEVIFHEEILKHQKEIFADLSSITKVFPRIIKHLSGIKSGGKGLKKRKLFSENDLLKIQKFFNYFTKNVLPLLLEIK